MTILDLFSTRVHHASLVGGKGWTGLHAELEAAALGLAAEDRAGRAWCREHGYGGYTSYASLDDLPRRMSVFDDLRRRLDREAAAFADACAFDLGGGRLKLDSLWVNVLKPGAAHFGPCPPPQRGVGHGVPSHAARRGGASAGGPPPSHDDGRPAPTRRRTLPALRTFVEIAPSPGDVVLWESWLRHEVVANRAKADRISVSFNYAWSGRR